MAHALLSPSSSSRWLRCPASVKMSMNIPQSTNSHAELGTAVHEICEVCLLTDVEADTFIGHCFNNIEVTKKMAEDAQLYVDYVRNIVGSDGELHVEVKVDLSVIYENTFGSSDSVVIVGNELHIVDYKNGKGYVSPEENSQLMLYAIGAYEMFDYGHIEKIVLHIVQPNASTGGHCSQWETTVEELLEFAKFARKQALNVHSDNPDCVAGEKQCEWCPAKAVCPVLYKTTIETVQDGFESLDEVKVEQVSLEQVANILRNKNLILQVLKAYEERAYEELSKGHEIDGFKLVEGRKNKRWVNEIEAFSILSQWFDEEELTTKKLMTPTQLHKLVMSKVKETSDGSLEETFTMLWETPSGLPMIAPATDKRPAINIKDDFETL